MTGVRVITATSNQLAAAKAEAHEKNYILRTHKSCYDNCWKLTIVDKELVASWNPLVKEMRMLILAAPIWTTTEKPAL